LKAKTLLTSQSLGVVASTSNIRDKRAQYENSCPECGSQMIEVQRCNENKNSYIWYECVEENCDGQWLRKQQIL
jgi:predicted RNA-binding Zn-ribbon protein involved in translation (DUF1610 family)